MFDAKFEFNLEVARQGRHTWLIPTDWTRSHPAYAETSTRLGIIILSKIRLLNFSQFLPAKN